MRIPLDQVISLILSRTGSTKSARQEIATQLARLNHHLERIADHLDPEGRDDTTPGQ